MDIRLEGRTALVTGSTRGIGYAAAKLLAESGASILINGRDEPGVRAAVDALRACMPGADLGSVVADVSTLGGVGDIIDQVPSIDILVCNAAVFDWIGFFESEDEDWTRHFEINVMSGVRLARHYLKQMLERDRGRIVLVASEAGLNIPADMIHYGVSKAAQIALARGLAELTAGTNVTVNSVLPGPTASSGAGDFLDEYAAENQVPIDEAAQHLVQSIRPTSLIRRLATVDEVASMIVYACSDQASATNGASLRAEGGLLRHL